MNEKLGEAAVKKISVDKVVVFLPALDEERGIGMVVQGLQELGIREIVVVDGGSTDRTAEVARQKGAVVIPQQGKGKGAAFKTFLASYPLHDDAIVLMLDADASYSPQDAPTLVQKILEGAEVASGNRAILVFNLRSLAHAIGGRAISLLASLLFLKWHPDFTSGYWAFRASALKKIRVVADEFDLEANLFAECAKRGLKLAIVPVSYQKRVGEAKLGSLDALKIFASLLKYRFSK